MRKLSRREMFAKSAQYAAGVVGVAAGAGCGGGSGRTIAPAQPGGGGGDVTNPNLTTVQLQAMQDSVAAFMVANQVPGVSIAIALNDTMQYTRGFGVADLTTGEPVTPNHLFRIASVTKPITAVTVIELINAGKMTLKDPVFGPKGWLGNMYAPYKASAFDVTAITVCDLLTHSCGGWTDIQAFFEPTGSTVSQQTIIKNTLQQIALVNKPGSTFGYSNFGYVLLGRVIEAVVGKGTSYADAAAALVLQKCGISDMRIAGDTLADRYANEVVYYDPKRTDYTPYNYGIHRLDSAGGWVATASDLVQFLMRVDKIPAIPDIVPASNAAVTITDMTTIAKVADNTENYALGWGVNSIVPATQWQHVGSESGNTSELMRTPSDYCWAILTNTSNNNQIMGPQLENVMAEAISAMA